MITLKPCPFCGCKIILLTRKKVSWFEINCPDCAVFMVRRGVKDEELEEAVEGLLARWNRRVEGGKG
jgi:Lar family restriction alleviation protein